MTDRRIAIVAHPERGVDDGSVSTITGLLRDSGLSVDPHPDRDSVGGCELILVVGGDGTILRAAELSRAVGVPILGVNYGHVGFLSEAKPELSSFKVDTVLFSTATGSTAYNFSGGGPIVWPDVEAMVLTPVAAHALFTRPLVVGPASRLELHVVDGDARAKCDGRRELMAPAGSSITAVKGSHPVLLARLDDVPFSGRLVDKFKLPVHGWRE